MAASVKPVRFTVVVPTRHRNDTLLKCLMRLRVAAAQLPAGSCDIIVSDDGTLTTAQALVAEQFPEMMWVQGPVRGPAANRNHAARYARTEWLLFVDDDCLATPELLLEYTLSITSRPDCDVFEGKTVADRPQRRYDEEAPINETGGNLWACNFCIRTSLYLQIGGFDEMFPYSEMEDVDLSYRLKLMHVGWTFVSDAVVVHPLKPSSPTRFGRALECYQYYIGKHRHPATHSRVVRLHHLVYSLTTNSVKLLSFKFRGWRVFVHEHIFLARIIFAKPRLTIST